jgi:hypothetical protein
MSAHRVTAPDLSNGEKPKGPASYFPSIEKTYGRPIQDWLDIVVAQLDEGKTHMDVVATLKSAYSLGHGHANALVAYVKAALAKA